MGRNPNPSKEKLCRNFQTQIPYLLWAPGLSREEHSLFLKLTIWQSWQEASSPGPQELFQADSTAHPGRGTVTAQPRGWCITLRQDKAAFQHEDSLPMWVTISSALVCVVCLHCVNLIPLEDAGIPTCWEEKEYLPGASKITFLSQSCNRSQPTAHLVGLYKLSICYFGLSPTLVHIGKCLKIEVC